MPKLGTCADCNDEELIGPRGLCNACYKYHHNHHTLDKFPRSTWKREELLAEYDLCQRRGLSVQAAAGTIGVSVSALRRAIQRARKHTRLTTALWDQGQLERKIN